MRYDKISAISRAEARLLKKLVCEKCDVSWKDFSSPNKHRDIAYARFVFMYVLNTHFGISLPEIANLMGLHHTTVLNGVRRMRKVKGSDSFYSAVIEAITFLMDHERYGHDFSALPNPMAFST